MEDGIRTFMDFLKADKEKPCQKLSAMFRRKRRSSVDPTLLNLMKKVNQKVSLDTLTTLGYVIIISDIIHTLRKLSYTHSAGV